MYLIEVVKMTVISILEDVRNWLDVEICENFKFKKDGNKKTV